MYTEKEVRELCEKMFMEGRLFEKSSYQPMSIPQTIDYYFKKFTAQHSVQLTIESVGSAPAVVVESEVASPAESD